MIDGSPPSFSHFRIPWWYAEARFRIYVTLRFMKADPLRRALLAAFLSPVLLAAVPPMQLTPGKAMDVISAAFRREIRGKHFARPVSYRTEDWPTGVALIRAERGNLPILTEPSLTQAKLQILGIAHPGEIFQSLGCQQIIRLLNPFGRVDDSGTWCKVRLLNGKMGWLMAKGEGQASSFLASIRRPSSPSSSASGWLATAVVLGLLLFLWKSLSRRKSRQTSYVTSSGNGYDASESRAPNAPPPAPSQAAEHPWPWRGEQVVLAPKNIYQKGFLLDTKVGHIEEPPLLGTGERIHKEGFLTSTEVAKIKEDFFGDPTAVVDKKGHEIGKIKTDLFGDKIIVDKDGKKIGEYKRDKK
jgi:hypothetical protein